MQLKLDELIRVQRGAQYALLDLEELSEDELEEVRARYEDMAKKAREKLDREAKEKGSSRRRLPGGR